MVVLPLVAIAGLVVVELWKLSLRGCHHLAGAVAPSAVNYAVVVMAVVLLLLSLEVGGFGGGLLVVGVLVVVVLVVAVELLAVEPQRPATELGFADPHLGPRPQQCS